MIQQNESFYTVAMMADLLSVSRSGYYDWKQRSPSQHTQQDEQLTEDVERLYFLHKRRAGAPRIRHYLREKGIYVSKKKGCANYASVSFTCKSGQKI